MTLTIELQSMTTTIVSKYPYLIPILLILTISLLLYVYWKEKKKN